MLGLRMQGMLVRQKGASGETDTPTWPESARTACTLASRNERYVNSASGVRGCWRWIALESLVSRRWEVGHRRFVHAHLPGIEGAM